MTTRTLTDELRSVLLQHALQAPEPNATVDRILAETVGSVLALGSADEAPASAARPGRRRSSVQQLMLAAVVAVLLLSVAGINSVRNHNSARSAALAKQRQAQQQAQPTAAAGSLALPRALDSARPAKSLDCSKIAGSRLINGLSDDFTLSTGERGFLYELLCVGPNGQRSASEVQMFEQAGGKLQYLKNLPHPSGEEHLDFLTAGSDTVFLQFSVPSRPMPGEAPGREVRSMAWVLTDPNGGQGPGALVAKPCARESLLTTLTSVPDASAPSWRLAVRNQTQTACALEGFPQVRALHAGSALSTALPTLSGPAGGVTKKLVAPIIVLSRGAVASAIIEQSAVTAANSCLRSDQLDVALPSGVSLGRLPAQLAGCGLVVHPLVGNAIGSD